MSNEIRQKAYEDAVEGWKDAIDDGHCDNGRPAHGWVEDAVANIIRAAIEAVRDELGPKPEPRSAAAIILDRGKVLAVFNKRAGGWALPGGKVEPGETDEQACRRELTEETGFTAARVEFVFGDRYKDGGRHVSLYRVTVGSGSLRPEHDDEPMPQWMSPELLMSQSPFAEFYRRAFPPIGLVSLQPAPAKCEECGGTDGNHRHSVHEDIRTGVQPLPTTEVNSVCEFGTQGCALKGPIDHWCAGRDGETPENALRVAPVVGRSDAPCEECGGEGGAHRSIPDGHGERIKCPWAPGKKSPKTEAPETIAVMRDPVGHTIFDLPGPMHPAAVEYIRADVVEKRVAEATDQATEGTATTIMLELGGVIGRESVTDAARRVVAERDEANEANADLSKDLDAALAKVRELQENNDRQLGYLEKCHKAERVASELAVRAETAERELGEARSKVAEWEAWVLNGPAISGVKP